MNSNMYNVGIERESLRCTAEGKLSEEPHSVVFGDRKKNLFITTDFGEAQLELRTPVCSTTEECHEKLENITDVVLNEIGKKGEFLWPYSMPCILPDVEHYNFGIYKENEEEMRLFKKYGLKMYSISGVHLNFSIQKDFYEKLKEKKKDLPYNMDDAYFKIIRNYLKKVWMLIYLFGATPRQLGDNADECVCSLRNSYKEGFKNKKLDPLNYENKELYIKSVEYNIKSGNISGLREIYTPIRAKGREKNNIDQLKNEPINHIEVRICDIEPFDKCGISKEQMDFTVAFLFYCLLIDEDEYTIDYKKVAENGITEQQKIVLNNEIEKILKICKKYNLGFGRSILNIQEKLANGINNSKIVSELIKEKGYINGLMELAQDYSTDAKHSKHTIIYKKKKIHIENVDLIKDAIIKGVDYNIIDKRTSDPIVEFRNDKKSEIIIGETQTSKDNYVVPYLTDNKSFAKKVMKESNINVCNRKIIDKNYSVYRIIVVNGKFVSAVLMGKKTKDVSDEIDSYYKKIAEKTSKLFGSHVFGIDMIIKDNAKKDYAIIDVDSTPSLNINQWPDNGEGKRIGVEILKMLKLVS